MTSTGSANDGLNDRIGVSFREMEKLLINCNNARIKAKNILSSRHRPEAYNLHNSFYEWEIHVCSICNHRVSNVHSTCFLHMTSLPKPTRLVTFIYFPPQLSHHASASRVFGAFFFRFNLHLRQNNTEVISIQAIFVAVQNARRWKSDSLLWLLRNFCSPI